MRFIEVVVTGLQRHLAQPAQPPLLLLGKQLVEERRPHSDQNIGSVSLH